MNTTNRPYRDSEGDFERLARFLSRKRNQVRRYSTWCIGRLVDWRFGLYENKTAVPTFWRDNAQLWLDGFGRLAGFAISESGDGGFAIITAPGYRFLYSELLAWVCEHWGGRGRLSTEVTSHQASELAALEGAGFAHASSFFTERFDLTAELARPASLPIGFSIVDMRTHPDYRSQRRLRNDAFAPDRQLSDAELDRQLSLYNHSHTGPIYHPDTDLCVMAGDGTFVAGCEALIDARNAEADIERVCTHREYRRRGFARAVILECLHRLKDMGLLRAYITGYSDEAIVLYRSLGPAAESTSLIYVKEAAKAPPSAGAQVLTAHAQA